MSRRLITGNEALALGALQAGVKVVTGYPGTPSTGALAYLLDLQQTGHLPDGEHRHLEWSVNEKVALEIAAGAAWAGQRALCTMKMSGVNVAYDSLCSIAYSGCVGGLVIYVADDPGVNAGMVEQDSRGFALMADLPMLEPASVPEIYRLTQVAFDLSEQTKAPVFVRLVTATANSYGPCPTEQPGPVLERSAVLVKDIAAFTKAGAAIAMAQHRDAIARLALAGQLIAEWGVNTLNKAPQAGGLGILVSGVVAAYLEEALELVARAAAAAGRTFDREAVSMLRVAAVNPFPSGQAGELLRHCETILVLEELEPHLEKDLYVAAHRMGHTGRIVGKLDGTLSRIGEYGVGEVARGIAAAMDLPLPDEMIQGYASAEKLAAARPITVCAGCPHRGTFMAINTAIRKLRYKPGEVMVTGDIGCTILGMNPPFNTVWTEISMGASIGLAQGYVAGGVQTPVIATIGDSTFFHAGVPALVNAVQHQIPMTLVIMDNGWTAMTGMQVNPGTAECFQPSDGRTLDIAQVIPSLGVDYFVTVDPFDLPACSAAIQEALRLPGVKVVLARQECAIQAMREGKSAGEVTVVEEKCNQCKLCISVTGCPAITLTEAAISIDPALCYGCGLCVEICNRDAIVENVTASQEV
jgi:indolepyruvate ferredoxin oxidoreductase, alpha subunit